MLERYTEQVRVLLGLLPDIAKEDAFALKGGTAINLFYRDMPRLSVDIDLAYLPTRDYDTALADKGNGYPVIIRSGLIPFHNSYATNL